jgi:hypothetical protein
MRRLMIALLLWATAITPLWADCKLGKVADLKPIVTDYRLYVPGKINGKDVLFMIDSGADTFLFRDAAAELGMTVGGYAGTSYGATGGEAADARATVESLELGKWIGRNFSLRAVGPGGDGTFDGVPVIGALGEDILSHFDVEMSIREGLFHLYQPDGCANANLAYWTDSYNVADMTGFTATQQRIQVAVRINDRQVNALIDTGAPFTHMSLDTARALGITPESPGVQPAGSIQGIHGQAEPSWTGVFDSFAFDQERISPAKINMYRFAKRESEFSRIRQANFDFQMLLGFDFLRAHHVLFSHSQRKVYISYVGGQPFGSPKPSQPKEASK